MDRFAKAWATTLIVESIGIVLFIWTFVTRHYLAAAVLALVVLVAKYASAHGAARMLTSAPVEALAKQLVGQPDLQEGWRSNAERHRRSATWSLAGGGALLALACLELLDNRPVSAAATVAVAAYVALGASVPLSNWRFHRAVLERSANLGREAENTDVAPAT